MTRTHISRFALAGSGICATAVMLAFSGQAAAQNAGRVEFAMGNVMVKGSNGTERALARGDQLQSGDNVQTNTGRAQIRFTDGGFVSLQPNTEFGVQQYAYSGQSDGNERGFFSLVRGAMRTVTGAVGRVNRANYRITTPTATVGIRGTGGIISVVGPITSVFGTSGTWTLTNPAGTVDVLPGQVGIATGDTSSPPQQGGGQQPVTPPTPQPDLNFNPNENRTPDGAAIIPVTGNLDGALLLESRFTRIGPFPFARLGWLGQGYSGSTTKGELDENSDLKSFTWTTPNQSVTLEYSGTHMERYSDEFVSVARLVGTLTETIENSGATPVTHTYAANANQGLFWTVIKEPTAVMPTTGIFTYNLLHATAVAYTAGNLAPGQVTSATGHVDFGSNTISNQIAFSIGGVSYGTNLSGNINGNVYSMTGYTSSSGGACTSSCSSTGLGGFGGAQAQRAVTEFRVNTPSGNAMGGMVVLGKGAPYVVY